VGYTKHCLRRMSQRGIKMEHIDLVMRFGQNQGDKIVLNRKMIKYIISQRRFSHLKSKLLKLMDKGGVIAVCENSSIITTYNVNSYKRVR